jgi:hypothetical protein
MLPAILAGDLAWAMDRLQFTRRRYASTGLREHLVEYQIAELIMLASRERPKLSPFMTSPLAARVWLWWSASLFVRLKAQV